jgi:hypothetical protein
VARIQKLRTFGFPVAVAIALALAPVAEAGVSAQHNETLVVV